MQREPPLQTFHRPRFKTETDLFEVVDDPSEVVAGETL